MKVTKSRNPQTKKNSKQIVRQNDRNLAKNKKVETKQTYHRNKNRNFDGSQEIKGGTCRQLDNI
jgi:hypothetical protein